MSQKNKWQKQCEKKLSLENLESRQLLSAVPLTANPDLVDAAAIYAPVSNDAYVDFSDTEEAPAALQAEVGYDDYDDPVTASAVGNKLSVSFEAEGNQQYSVVFWGYDIAADKDTITVKNVKPSAKKIQDGRFTYSYTGKANTSYTIAVVKGKLSAKQIQGDEIPEGFEVVGETGTFTIPTYKFVAKPGTATENSVTFQQKADNKTEPWYENFELDNLVFSAKFDGAKKASVYTVEDECLLLNGEETPYTIDQNEDGSVTIYGLASNTKQSFQVAVGSIYEHTTSAYSSNLSISTTKVQKAAPDEVWAEYNMFNEEMVAPNAKVRWYWEANEGDTSATTFTISYTYTDAKGKVVTKNATTKATVNDEGEGEFVVTKLLSNTEYTFSVSANKTKDLDASVFVSSEGSFVTPTVIPAPTLKKVSVTDSTATLQITNWDKMEDALQQVEDDFGGEIWITAPGYNFDTDEEEGCYARFNYLQDDDGNWRWVDLNNDSIMKVTTVNKKHTATITITGLEANKDYNFQATAYSSVENDEIEFVAAVQSKALKVKTAINSYAPVTELVVSNETARSMDIAWNASNGATNYIATVTPTTGGKAVTKTVKGTAVTVTGLTPYTNYDVSVVVKADKNGSQSIANETTAMTAEEFGLQDVIQIQNNHYALNFGVDMSHYSGRLDFSVKGSGKGDYIAPNGSIAHWSDSIPATTFSLFFGENADAMAQDYRATHPDAKLLVMTPYNSFYDFLLVTSKKYNVNLEMGFSFQPTNSTSTLEFDFDDTGYNYEVSGTLQLVSGTITDDITGQTFTASMGKKFNRSFKMHNLD